MITLRQISFEPSKFPNTANSIEPIRFEEGINLIIGERSKSPNDLKEQEKMNGVGKSILIEAINFCLFKDSDESRITRIPLPVMPDDVYVCLALDIERKDDIRTVVIKRPKDETKKVLIIDNGREKEYEHIDDAKEYVEYLFIPNQVENHPSLRNLLSILIREEDTSYKNILRPFTHPAAFADLLKPHLYFFNFDIEPVEKIKKIFLKFTVAQNALQSLKKDFKNQGISPKEVRSYINDLEDKVKKLDLSINQLRPGESIKQYKQRLNGILLDLESLNSQKAAKEFQISKIKKLPKAEGIDVEEIKVVYNKYVLGLGDMIKKSFDQVLEFKEQIETFQNKLMGQKLDTLRHEIEELEQRIEPLDKEASEIYEISNAREKIKDLTDAVKEHRSKNEQLQDLVAKFKIMAEREEEQKLLKKSKAEEIERLETQIIALGKDVGSFEKDLVDIHYAIAGNKTCQFSIGVNETKKEFMEFDYRIKLDGSSGINRIKTFIYDILLMLNTFTSKRHPGFLIHDNIFASTGKDDMVKALNYLFKQEGKKKKFQYIVTINKDEFDSHAGDFDFDYKLKVRTTLTRQDPLLRTTYSEIKD